MEKKHKISQKVSDIIKSKRLKALKGMVPSILELGDECKLCSITNIEGLICQK